MARNQRIYRSVCLILRKHLTYKERLGPAGNMQVFPTSLLVVAALIVLALRGPRSGLWAFMILTPLAATAAFNLPAVGGASILLADVAAMAIFALVIFRSQGVSAVLGTMRVGQPGFWLGILTVFAIIATLFFPTLFRGDTLVFSIARAGNEAGVVSSPLRPSTGNLTQLFRHLLGVCVFLALATLYRLKPDPGSVRLAFAVATVLNLLLGWADVLSYGAGLSSIMEPVRTANYAILYDVHMAGLKRMIGGFPEASSFGYFSLGLFGFWLHYWTRAKGDGLVLAMLLVATFCVIRSTSSAAYVGMVAFVILYGLVTIVSGLGARVSRRGARIAGMGVVLVWMAALGLFAAYEFVPAVEAYLDRAIFTKLDGVSGVERFSWNAQAIQNFRDTMGLGAGLGSVRASSWLIAVLASLGWIGALLYFMFLGSLLAGSRSWRGATKADWVADSARAGCIAFLVSAILTSPTPDLTLTFYACAGIAAGLTRGVRLREAQTEALTQRSTLKAAI